MKSLAKIIISLGIKIAIVALFVAIAIGLSSCKGCNAAVDPSFSTDIIQETSNASESLREGVTPVPSNAAETSSLVLQDNKSQKNSDVKTPDETRNDGVAKPTEQTADNNTERASNTREDDSDPVNEDPKPTATPTPKPANNSSSSSGSGSGSGNTSTPTNTPVPTATPKPTATPSPTPTSTPTPTPSSACYVCNANHYVMKWKANGNGDTDCTGGYTKDSTIDQSNCKNIEPPSEACYVCKDDSNYFKWKSDSNSDENCRDGYNKTTLSKDNCIANPKTGNGKAWIALFFEVASFMIILSYVSDIILKKKKINN